MSFTATQDNLTHSIDQLADGAEHPHSARRSPSNNLFNAQFLKTHTCNKFSDFGHFVAAGFPDTDFESIPWCQMESVDQAKYQLCDMERHEKCRVKGLHGRTPDLSIGPLGNVHFAF
jgi:hypothetical protein